MKHLEASNLIRTENRRDIHTDTYDFYGYYHKGRPLFYLTERGDKYWEAEDLANGTIKVFMVETEEEARDEMVRVLNGQHLPVRRDLPGTLSKLIRRAVSDAIELDRSYYMPDNSVWYDNNRKIGSAGRCLFNFSGAVMAGSLRADSFTSKVDSLDVFHKPDADKLKALDFVAQGKYADAFNVMGKNAETAPAKHGISAIEESLKRLSVMQTDKPGCHRRGYYGWILFEQFLIEMLGIAHILDDNGC